MIKTHSCNRAVKRVFTEDSIEIHTNRMKFWQRDLNNLQTKAKTDGVRQNEWCRSTVKKLKSSNLRMAEIF